MSSMGVDPAMGPAVGPGARARIHVITSAALWVLVAPSSARGRAPERCVCLWHDMSCVELGLKRTMPPLFLSIIQWEIWHAVSSSWPSTAVVHRFHQDYGKASVKGDRCLLEGVCGGSGTSANTKGSQHQKLTCSSI